jgi:hypothetical protein
MAVILSQPLVVLVLALVPQLLAANAGDRLRRRARAVGRRDIADLDTILPAALTLLGLIIGFSFSMAVSRYDQRKNLEEAEANAIGTEHVRADFLPASDAARVRGLLARYTDQRIQFYQERARAPVSSMWNRRT